MAKQVINIGISSNDRRGDSLRIGANKINNNFDEIYTKLGDGSNLFIDLSTPPLDNQILIFNAATNKFVSRNVVEGLRGPAGPQGERGAVGPQGIQGNNGAAGPQGPTGPAGPIGSQGPQGPQGPTGATGATGAVGPAGPAGPTGPIGPQGLIGPQGPAGNIPSRTASSGTTASLSNGASADLNITGFKSYVLLSLQTSAASWVRLYTTDAARTADSSRIETDDPLPGTGIIAEVITSGAEEVPISPGLIGFNLDNPAVTTIYARVTNKTVGTAAITVTLKLIQMEE